MIRFILYYFFVIHYRVFRVLFRSKITGDNNYLSSPIFTVNKILSDPILPPWTTFVDIGCGEGLIGLFVRLIKRKTIILHDTQRHFLSVITVLSRLLCISKVTISQNMLSEYPQQSVFFCVWTSWSSKNRQELISKLESFVSKGAVLITIGHLFKHGSFTLIKTGRRRFAWGWASVYYYRHD